MVRFTSIILKRINAKRDGWYIWPYGKFMYPCHKQIHALYTNEEITARLTTIHKLKEDPQLSRFLKWLRK